MTRMLLSTAALGAFLLSASASATDRPSLTGSQSTSISAAATAPVRLAKAKKKKGADKPAEKLAPEGAKADPRASAPAPAEAAAPAAPEPGARRGMGRIEFDDRLIQGQTNKANAIYLFERRESSLRSLLKKRTDFHEEIDETLE